MNLVNNILVNIAQHPWKLGAVIVVAVGMLGLAAVCLRRGRRGAAVLPGVFGVGAAVLAITVIARHGTVVAGDSIHLERLAGVELTTAAPRAEDWPQWRGPNRDGIARAEGIQTDWKTNPPRELWRVPLGGGYSSFAAIGDSAWTQDYREGRERIVCLDTATGQTRWSHDYAVDYSGFRAGYAKGPRATPTVHGGRVYTVGATGQFLCLDAQPGDGKAKVHWQHDLLAEFGGDLPTWGVACSPLIEGGLVIVQPGGPRGSVVAFDRHSGAPVWTALDDPSGYSSPIAATLADKRTIIAFTGRRVVGLNPADGALLWEYDFPTEHNGNIATPVVAGNTVFLSAAYGSGCALLTFTPGASSPSPEVVFRQKRLLRTHHMTVVLHDGHVYGSHDFRGDWMCIDLRSAKSTWESSVPGKGNAILADGHLIILSEKGTLSLVEATPSEFRLKGKLTNLMSDSECWALPVLSAGRLYLRDSEKAICLQMPE